MWRQCSGAVTEDGLLSSFPGEQMSFAVFCRSSYLNPIDTWHLCLMVKLHQLLNGHSAIQTDGPRVRKPKKIDVDVIYF